MPTCKLSSAIQCKKYFIHHPLVKNTIKIISRKDLTRNMTNSEIEDIFYKNLKDSPISVKRIIL